MLRQIILLTTFFVALSACQEMPVSHPSAKIIAVGDSLMAWNAASGSSIPDVVEQRIGAQVVDRTVSAAWMQTSFDDNGTPQSGVQSQYIDAKWSWAIVNGGGNDLMLGCGCTRCDATLNNMISPDGQRGQIPDFVKMLRDKEIRVVYVGYLRSPDLITPIEHCKAEGDELDARLTRMARGDSGITFVSSADIAQPGDASYFSFDRIHPSRKSSRLIGERIASVIQSASN